MLKKSGGTTMGGTRRTYDWPRPALTVDVALFTVVGELQDLRLQVLLVERGEAPFRGRWALPGGFVREDEDLPAAALRELAEETGVRDVFLEQVAAIGTPGRDPRGHTVTVVYVALVPPGGHHLEASGDARATRWFDVQALPPLAFDHQELVGLALEHLQQRLGETPVCFELLPTEFTLSELQALCEAILGRPLDRRNFRRKVQELGFVAPAGGVRAGAHRPAQVFRFVPEAFARHAGRARSLPF
jgi:8-oxo-dGTP diphosphatase